MSCCLTHNNLILNMLHLTNNFKKVFNNRRYIMEISNKVSVKLSSYKFQTEMYGGIPFRSEWTYEQTSVRTPLSLYILHSKWWYKLQCYNSMNKGSIISIGQTNIILLNKITSGIIYCDMSPCVNQGVCLDKDTGYKCYCPNPYDGLRCEIGKYVY